MTLLESSPVPSIHKKLESLDTIRILRLYPAQSHSDPLEFDLEHRARSELLIDCSESTMHYNAVSYVWGTPVFSHLIRSRQQTAYLKITPSVDSFLRQFRKKTSPLLLWVDAICLDQKNDDEKSEQVPLMGEIYSQARKVRIWLGEGNENTNKVFKFLSLVAVMKRKNGTLSHALFMEALFKIFASESVQVLEGILCDPWFGRRWIIQEAVLGHSVIVHQGSHKISWELFTEGLIALLDVVSDLQLSDVGRYSLISTNTMLSARTRDILDCLWDFDKNVCSDERDRLFALYGFTPSSNTNDQGAPPAVEYNHSWPEVYSDFAALTIEKKGLSSILPHLIAFGGLSESNPELPSWVPNWSRERTSSYGRTSAQVHRNEGGRFHADVRFVEGNSSFKQIKMNVIIIGVVEDIGDMRLRKASGSSQLEYSASWDVSELRVLNLHYTTWRIFGSETTLQKPTNPEALEFAKWQGIWT